MNSVLIRGGTIIRSDGEERADVLIEDGIIAGIGVELKADETREAEGLLLFPGLIDCHVHFRDPGFPEKATMGSEARAAIFGGVTTVCDMPNTNPPTVTIATLADKVRRAEEIRGCDFRFFFNVMDEGHLATFRELWTGGSGELKRLRSRCPGLKIYLDHSTGNQKIDDDLVDEVFSACAEFHAPLVAHCEDPKVNAEATAKFLDPKRAITHSLCRPPEGEEASIANAFSLVEKYGTMLHIAHLSTLQGLALVRDAKKRKLPVTCEVAPHHLFLTTDDYDQGGAFLKMNPPLRTAPHLQALWSGIEDGSIDAIATDHAPHTLQEKSNPDLSAVPSGVPGVETMLPLLLSVAAGKFPGRKLRYCDIVRLCLKRPNEIFSLGKKEIEVGTSADIVLVDPNEEWVIHGKDLHYKCGWTPFEGWKVQGRVKSTL